VILQGIFIFVQILLNEKNYPLIIEKSINALGRGGIVVYPSDTVYGIAVDATSPEAIKNLDTLKQRRVNQKYSYNFSDIEMVKKYADINTEQEKILEKYLPGPYTFIVGKNISVRIPKDSIITEICKHFGKPVTATSANVTGHKPATNIKNLDAKIYLKADVIIEDLQFEPKQPSTIVDISKDKPIVIRSGELPFPR
jgi:L-threonylcarbamoyladenylate synthase